MSIYYMLGIRLGVQREMKVHSPIRDPPVAEGTEGNKLLVILARSLQSMSCECRPGRTMCHQHGKCNQVIKFTRGACL